MLNFIKRIIGYCINIVCWLLVAVLKLTELLINAVMFLSMSICGIIGFGVFGLFIAYLLYCVYIGITVCL